MDSLIYKLAVRRVGRRRDQPAEETTPATDQNRIVRRAKLFRRGLIFVLSAVGATAFIEVILLPGKLVRERYATPSPSTDTVDAIEDAKTAAPSFFFTSDAERQRQQEASRQRREQRVRASHARLGDAIMLAERDVDASLDSLESRLSIQRDAPVLRGIIPSALAPVVASEPTAQAAWADMLAIRRDTNKAISEARDLHRLMTGRFASNTFLDEDEKSMATAIEQTNHVVAQERRFRSDIDHLSVLSRGRTALVRRTAEISPTGDLP